jgi:hypothetical protein
VRPLLERWAIVVTASRLWDNHDAIADRLWQYPQGPNTILFHGAARGGDTIASSLGRERGFTVVPIPYVSEEGNRGGHYRNHLMLDELVVFRNYTYRTAVEAFPRFDLPDWRESGTVGCVHAARDRGLYVHVWGIGWMQGMRLEHGPA